MTFKVTTVRLAEEALEELRSLSDKLGKDRSDVMREAFSLGLVELKLRYSLELYGSGKISFGRLVELSGLGYREMLKELRRRNVQFRYGEERFTEESRAAVE